MHTRNPCACCAHLHVTVWRISAIVAACSVHGLCTKADLLHRPQVYDYASIKEWFRTGNRVCPRTNLEVLDAQAGCLTCRWHILL